MPTARLEARISVELHASLKRAAEIEGRTMTDLSSRCTGCRTTRHRTVRCHQIVTG